MKQNVTLQFNTTIISNQEEIGIKPTVNKFYIQCGMLSIELQNIRS